MSTISDDKENKTDTDEIIAESSQQDVDFALELEASKVRTAQLMLDSQRRREDFLAWEAKLDSRMERIKSQLLQELTEEQGQDSDGDGSEQPEETGEDQSQIEFEDTVEDIEEGSQN